MCPWGSTFSLIPQAGVAYCTRMPSSRLKSLTPWAGVSLYLKIIQNGNFWPACCWSGPDFYSCSPIPLVPTASDAPTSFWWSCWLWQPLICRALICRPLIMEPTTNRTHYYLACTILDRSLLMPIRPLYPILDDLPLQWPLTNSSFSVLTFHSFMYPL